MKTENAISSVKLGTPGIKLGGVSGENTASGAPSDAGSDVDEPDENEYPKHKDGNPINPYDYVPTMRRNIGNTGYIVHCGLRTSHIIRRNTIVFQLRQFPKRNFTLPIVA